MRYSQNQKLKVEISLSHLIGLEKTSTLSEIIKDLSEKKSPELIKALSTRDNIPDYKATLPENQVINKNSLRSPVETEAPKTNAYSHLTEFDTEGIIKRWDDFVNLVMSEKSLVLGPLLNSVTILKVTGTKLELETTDLHSRTLFEQHKDYIAKKTIEFFGKRIDFMVKLNNDIKEPNKLKISKVTEDDTDPYVRAIINEFGGEVIS